MSDPMITTQSPAEREATLRNLFKDNPEQAAAWNAALSDPAALRDAKVAKAALGSGTRSADTMGSSTQQAQTRDASTDTKPVTSPPQQNTVPPTLNGKADANYTTASDNATLVGGKTVGQLRATYEQATDEDKEYLKKEYGAQKADNGQFVVLTSKLNPTNSTSSTGSATTDGATSGVRSATSSSSTSSSSFTGTLASALTGGGGNILALGAASTAASAAGLSGLGFALRKAVRSASSTASDTAFISALNSNMSIESLLYYWMAYASDKYDKKLREKMEEWTLQQQLEDEQETTRSVANAIGGIVGLVTGTGSVATSIATGLANTINAYSSATSGTGKSSTVLAQEVQILVQQWKTISDLTSNLSKDLHEMAMTAVRNLR